MVFTEIMMMKGTPLLWIQRHAFHWLSLFRQPLQEYCLLSSTSNNDDQLIIQQNPNPALILSEVNRIYLAFFISCYEGYPSPRDNTISGIADFWR